MTVDFPPFSLRVGTRTSALARYQTDQVIQALRAAWPGLVCTIVPFVTEGDRILDRPLPEIGGKGLFTQLLEEALSAQTIDLAVHSLKDLPTENSPGLCVGATMVREDPRDVVIARSGVRLDHLPLKAVVGTSSLRRGAQVRARRPDLQIQPVRGNVDTRVRKALDPSGPYDAVILAAAGLRRLGLEQHVTEWLAPDEFLPAPGQGALGIQCRAGDERTLALLTPLHHADTWTAVVAERAFLATLEAGCSAPVAAWGRVIQDPGPARLYLDGLVATPDGAQVVRVAGSGADSMAAATGTALARQALEQGAWQILEGVRVG